MKNIKHFLTIKDLTPQELFFLVEKSDKLQQKTKKNKDISNSYTSGKKAVSFFSKSSSRTKSAWEVGCSCLGMMSSFNDTASSQLGKKESIIDSANVFSQFYDIMGWRCMKYEDIAEFAKYSSIPCINLLCDKNHPTQAIADLLTIYNVFKTIKGLKVVFVGACNNNVARSLIEGLAMYGAHYVGIGPTLAHPSSEELAFYQKLAQENGGSVEFTTDINAVKDADVIYQDVFLDLGESMDLWPERLTEYTGYQVNAEIAKLAKENYIYMHCLPAINGTSSEYTKYISDNFGKQFSWVANGEVEVTKEVFQSKNSVVFQQAHNRLFAMEAIIKWLLTVNAK